MKNSSFVFFFFIFTSILFAQTPAFDWAKKFGGKSDDYAYSIAVDTAGNVYTAGNFHDTLDADPGVNTYNLIANAGGLSEIFISKVDAAGNFIWAKKMGGLISDFAFSITLDKYSNVYVAGYFKGTADFDPSASNFNLTSTGIFDVFIAKYDLDGNFIWAQKFDGTGSEFCYAIYVDETGSIYTTGYFDSPTDFDPGSNTSVLTPFGDKDIFISKLDVSGNFLWVKQVGGSNADFARAIIVDTSRNIYVSGYFNGTADFDPSNTTFNLTSAGMDDVFVCKLDASGNFLWVKQFGGIDSDRGYSLTVDMYNNVYTTGFFTGKAYFNPATDTTNLISAGLDDAFISKQDASGNLMWVKQIGNTLFDEAKFICIDTSSNLYVTGSFNGNLDFIIGADTTHLYSAGGDDVFLCKMDSAGNYVWAKQVGGTANDYSFCANVDNSNNVYVAGFFQGTADFNPGTDTVNLISAGATDAFIFKMKQQAVASISENNLQTKFQLFPNPAANQIHLVFGNQISNASILVINSLGQKVVEKIKLNGSDFSFDVSGLTKGIYLFEIIQDKNVSTVKFIKN